MEQGKMTLQPVSIHAPARGATVGFSWNDTKISVSIHAPARGATKSKLLFRLHNHSFNPRTREGCDVAQPTSRENRRMFQSTHPRGVRRIDVIGYIILSKFQSTHPRGVRLQAKSPKVDIGKFQSTHPRGVRPAREVGCYAVFKVSIHAPARGAT